MKRRWMMLAALAALGIGLGAYGNAASPVEGEQFLAAWVGSWEGGGTGKFDMKLERAVDGALKGSVAVGTDGGDYTANFDTLSFKGNKLSGRYGYPLDAQGEIVIEGNFEATSATGTWTLVQKGTNQPFFNGTWKVSKK